VNLDNILWYVALPAEAAVVGLVLYRSVWRSFPFFCVYCIFELLSEIIGYISFHFFPTKYLTTYLVIMVLESAVEFGVLVELAWSVLRPLRASLSRKSLIVIAFLIVVLGAIIWPFTGIEQLGSLAAEMRGLVRLLQTVAVIRMLFFLVLAGFSQLLSVSWRDREMQIATGLGFASIVSLGVQIVQSHGAMGPMYRHLDQLVVASFDISLIYWIVCIVQKEAERREFTPQMQSILLAAAGSARVTRVAMKNTAEERPRNPRPF